MITPSLFLAVLSLAAITDYDGWSFLEGPTAEATGFFRVEKRDGRWRAVDPKGREFRPMGCDHVSYLGITCEALGYAPYHEYCRKAYPSDVEWMDETTSRLKDWGFNLLGNGAYNEKMRGRGFAYMSGVSVSGKMCQDPDADPDLYIVNGRNPGSYLPNMFSSRYAELCEEQAERVCTARRDDPWLFGYYIDNELAWWCGGTLEEGLFDEVMKKPPTHSARVALEAFLDGREVTKERKVEFLHLAARRYFEGACAAIRRHDPNHLILGCRFAGLGGAHEVVWKAAGEFCDVVTFNCYPYADLERGVLLDKEGGRPLVEVVREMEADVGKPVYITEWSFLGLDTEKPCKYGAGQRLPTQKERAKAIELFLTTMIGSGCCIGWNYFMWVDLPTLGTWIEKGEDGNYGLVREDGRPYEEVTAVFRRIQRGIPSDYERVERLSFPKGAYIDTGLAVTNAEICLHYSADAGSHDLFGCANGTYNSTYLGQSGDHWIVGGSVAPVDVGTVTAGEHRIRYTEWIAVVDGEPYGTGAQKAGTTPSNLLLGRYHRGNGFEGNVYSFAVTNRETKEAVIDLVPVVRRSDLTAGFYDTARDLFLTNAGTGKFGMPMLSAYEPVEKVSFRKGDYIDIGEPVAKVDIAMKYKAEAGPMDIFGSQWAAYNSLYLHQGSSQWDIGSSSGTVVDGNVSAGVHEVFYGADFKVTIDGADYAVPTASSSTSDCNLLIGKGYRGDEFAGDVYSFAVTNFNTRVAVVDLVPCRRRHDGEIGFFDRSSGRFFGNAGGRRPGFMMMLK